MRFDDRLATALGQPAESSAARQAIWKQLVDLLGQPGSAEPRLRAEALARLRAWRGEVPAAGRQGAAMLLAGRPLSSDLVQFFAEDATAVFAPLLAMAQLDEQDWTAFIPILSPIARALLRHRRDLPAGAVRALEMFRNADMVLGSSVQAPSTQPEPEAQRHEPQQEQPKAVEDVEFEFEFETGSDGVIRWCDHPSRASIVGLTIAHPAAPSTWGVDGQAAGAFRRRAPFRNARMLIASGGSAGGDWSISGVPSFDSATGRFTGYRGGARRPRAGERAEPVGLLGSSLTGDSLRQLAHEVRTPLNAIAGFAEMIEQQMLGPAALAYRERASAILAETRRIQDVLDDLDEAAQVAEGTAGVEPEIVDCAPLLVRITSTMGVLAAERGVLVGLSVAPQCPPALVDISAAERMTTRLLSATIGLAARGERIEVSVSPGEGTRAETCIAVTRPALIAGHDESRLLDACEGNGEEAGTAPALGMGFTLRLVRSLAEACHGRLALNSDRFLLSLPAVTISQNQGAADPMEARVVAD